MGEDNFDDQGLDRTMFQFNHASFEDVLNSFLGLLEHSGFTSFLLLLNINFGDNFCSNN